MSASYCTKCAERHQKSDIQQETGDLRCFLASLEFCKRLPVARRLEKFTKPLKDAKSIAYRQVVKRRVKHAIGRVDESVRRLSWTRDELD
jgi:hypothetical protein